MENMKFQIPIRFKKIIKINEFINAFVIAF